MFNAIAYRFKLYTMPLPPALAKKLATRGILTENEGKMCTSNIYYDIIYLLLVIHDLKVEVYNKYHYFRKGHKNESKNNSKFS